jgi:hypothetical protein
MKWISEAKPAAGSPVIQRGYYSIKGISIIMGWPMSRAKALLHEFHDKGMAIKYGLSFSLSLDYFNAFFNGISPQNAG